MIIGRTIGSVSGWVGAGVGMDTGAVVTPTIGADTRGMGMDTVMVTAGILRTDRLIPVAKPEPGQALGEDPPLPGQASLRREVSPARGLGR